MELHVSALVAQPAFGSPEMSLLRCQMRAAVPSDSCHALALESNVTVCTPAESGASQSAKSEQSSEKQSLSAKDALHSS